MPVRDAAQFIGAAVNSVLSQTMGDFELLVVDDRSSDESVAIVRRAQDPRILLLAAKGEGVSAARNTGLRAASGKYVAFLDADDLWVPEHLQLHIDHLGNRREVDLTFSSVKWIDEAGRPLGRPVSSHVGRFSYEDLLLEYRPVTTSSWVVRRSALDQAGGFDGALATGSDHDLCLRMALIRDLNVEGLERPQILYRRRPGQITADRARKAVGWCQLVDKHAALTRRATPLKLRQATARLRRALAALAFEEEAYAEAREHFSTALRLGGWPLMGDRRTWVMAAAMGASLLPDALRQPVILFGRRLMGGA
ncbi:glycosyltransferase [uncultured Paludibaculum sp.]|uniref:glycosyltransferase family 2 protein n=1 Tax=uncultured Paludibaculum sp. TaxID=1765020 RepID=UPI002AAB6CF1|nr:glycosyltransferase [uncultured Paludibaculum sp.]